MPYLVGVRRAHEDDGPIFGYLPATPGVDFAEEELDQDREGPEEGVVDKFVHSRNGLLALCLVRHDCPAACAAVWLFVVCVEG
jgi:hypothetical protein